MTVDPHQGITIAFPIDVKPQDYTYWDFNTQQAVPAKYQRTETYSGRTAYVFTVSVNGQVKDPKTARVAAHGSAQAAASEPRRAAPAAAQARLQTLRADPAGRDPAGLHLGELADRLDRLDDRAAAERRAAADRHRRPEPHGRGRPTAPGAPVRPSEHLGVGVSGG